MYDKIPSFADISKSVYNRILKDYHCIEQKTEALVDLFQATPKNDLRKVTTWDEVEKITGWRPQ